MVSPEPHEAIGLVEQDEPTAAKTRASYPTLFVTDAEIIRRLGVPEKIARAAITMLDRDLRSGFPQKQRLWGGRRYWPAVKVWFDVTYIPAHLTRDGTNTGRRQGVENSRRSER